MPTKPNPEKLRRELTENRYRLTDFDVQQKHGNWWVTLCGEMNIGPFDSEREAWQGLQAVIEQAERRREIRNSPYNR
jgi:hypothetical protein